MINSTMNELDFTGLFCPDPVYRTKLAIQKIGINDTLEIVTDDPISESEIADWARMNGHKLCNLVKDGVKIHFKIMRKK